MPGEGGGVAIGELLSSVVMVLTPAAGSGDAGAASVTAPDVSVVSVLWSLALPADAILVRSQAGNRHFAAPVAPQFVNHQPRDLVDAN